MVHTTPPVWYCQQNNSSFFCFYCVFFLSSVQRTIVGSPIPYVRSPMALRGLLGVAGNSVSIHAFNQPDKPFGFLRFLFVSVNGKQMRLLPSGRNVRIFQLYKAKSTFRRIQAVYNFPAIFPVIFIMPTVRFCDGFRPRKSTASLVTQ